MLLGVCLFAELLRTIDTARSELALANQRLKSVRAELTPESFRRLLKQQQLLRPYDDDPTGLSETEFVLAFLAEEGFVDQLTMAPIIKLYRKLDVDPDGRLSIQDIEKASSLKPTELKALRRQNTSTFATKHADRVAPIAQVSVESLA